MQRDFKGIWIPAQLYLDQSLTAVDKMLLMEIDSLDCGEGCTASNMWLAKLLGVTIHRISRGITKLEQKGLVTREKYDGRTRTVRSNLPRNIGGSPYTANNSELFKRTTQSCSKRTTQKTPVNKGRKCSQHGGIPRRNGDDRVCYSLVVDLKSVANEPEQAVIENLATYVETAFHITVGESCRKKWARNIKGLHSQGVSHKRMLSAIRFLIKCPHIRTYLKVRSAYQFRMRFLDIEQEMKHGKQSHTQVLSKIHSKVFKILKERTGCTDKDLSAKLCEWIKSIKALAKGDDSTMSCIVRNDLLVSPTEFVEQYAEWIQSQTEGWEDWSGNYTGFHPNEGKLWKKWVARQLHERGITNMKTWNGWVAMRRDSSDE